MTRGVTSGNSKKVAAVNRRWAGMAPGSYINYRSVGWRPSIAMGGQSIGNEVAAAVIHNSDSQSVLGRGAILGLGLRRSRYAMG